MKDEYKNAQADKTIKELMEEYSVDSVEQLAGVEMDRNIKEQRHLQHRYKIKIVFQVIGFYAIFIVCGVLFIKALVFFNVPDSWWHFISIVAVFLTAALIGVTVEYIGKQKANKLAEAEATKRKIPPEYDAEYTELTLKLYEMIYDLQRAEKALTVLNISYIKEQDITELDKRKMLSVLRDCEEKVAHYPSQIEALKQRRREILTNVKTNYSDEVFPLKPIFLDRKYNNIIIDPEYYDNNTWQYK